MSKVARRKKTITMDVAEFVISPLTYSEVEEHTVRSLDHNQKTKEPGLDRKLLFEELKRLALWTVACGLNNANDEITDARFQVAQGWMSPADYAAKIKPLEITVDSLFQNMDDILAGKLIREIFEFAGIKLTEEPASGETKASS